MYKNNQSVIKAMVVEDNDKFRCDYIKYLKYLTDLNVISEARNGFEALEEIKKNKPDIIFMDISMPRMDGITAAYLIKKKYPEIKIVFVTIYEKSILKGAANSLPVDGFICKSSISNELPKALKKLDIYVNEAV